MLHTHLPYLRHHGVWPVGEEWLFQAWGTSWLPVTRLLEELAAEGHRDVLTLGVTPMVAHQVADRRLGDDLGTWLGGQVWRSEEQRWHDRMPREVRDLSSFFWRRFAGLADYHEDVQRRGGLLAVWSALQDAGVIELLGGPATHPYLPLLTDPALIDAQLADGLASHARWTGAAPRGIWAPEMGYRPRGPVADATADPTTVDAHGTPTLPRTGPELPGLEEHYAAHGVSHVLVDAPTLIRAAGGAEQDWTVRPAPAAAGAPGSVVHDGVLIGDSDVVAYARDLSVAYHVWSPTAGYPGGVWYRDLYATGGYGVHPSWRVTDHTLPPDRKAVYEPERARVQTERDAEHLRGVLHGVLDGRPGELVVAAYDTELFGHWWFEGVAWLGGLLRGIAADGGLVTTTLASRRERHPPTRRLDLPESSWGYAKGHASWVTAETRPMWQELRRAEDRARTALAGGAGADAARAQVARELALLASSDWPFMVTRGNSAGYAADRVADHAAQLHRLCDAIEVGRVEERLVAEIAVRDDAPADVTHLLAALDPAGTARRPA
ncbi:1,4-alpha-glucan branching protein domain-containing protein [Nitriliruptor alkaliphilus]|uniref:1,4-alpha-glucan branching protein domain-containing protein n=1 Tax=Nitriliruptor alkaliphilus TaxID=427918 RepID=UPI0006983716|nr:1,4-alpha-glucan branching protein domain-containing protein [Nitriliruptor alkaliphilus]